MKPQQIEVVIEEPKKQPVKQLFKLIDDNVINYVELEFKPTKLQCPHCKQTVSDSYIYFVTIQSLIPIFKKVVTEVSYEIGVGFWQCCCICFVAWSLCFPVFLFAFVIPTICDNGYKDAVHRCPKCQDEIGKKLFEACE